MEELGFEIGDAFVEEAVVLPGAGKPPLQGAVLLRLLAEPSLQSGVLADKALDGVSGKVALEVPDPAQQGRELGALQLNLNGCCRGAVGIVLPPGGSLGERRGRMSA